MTREEAIKKLVDNDWSIEEATEQVEDAIKHNIPLQGQVNLLIKTHINEPDADDIIVFIDDDGNWKEEFE